MKQKRDILNKIMILEALIAVAWAAIVLIFTEDLGDKEFYFWGGFTCVMLAFVIAIGSLFLIHSRNNENLTEIRVIPVWVSLAYLGISVFINSIFVAIDADEPRKPLVVINVILLIGFIGFRMFTDNYAQRVNDQTKAVVEKLKPTTAISARLGVIVSSATDEDVKKKLLSLKETVDYSSNLTQHGTEAFQAQFLSQLGYIEGLLNSNGDKALVCQKIDEAMATWRGRNSVNASIQ